MYTIHKAHSQQSSCMHTLHVLRSVSVTVQVRDFQAVIGKEVRQQCLEKMGGKPDILLACVGGGSNAIGLFHEFVDDADVRLIGRQARHPASMCWWRIECHRSVP